MKVRKTLAIAALALVALSACSHKSDTPGTASGSPSAQAVVMSPDEAKAALLAAALKTAGSTFSMHATMDMGAVGAGQIDGVTDGANKKSQMTMDVAGTKMEARQIGNDMYIKGAPNLPDKWIHSDMSQLTGSSDAFGTAAQSFAILNGVTEVTANADGTFSGQADPQVALDKAAAVQKSSLESLVKAAKGKKIDFTATVKDGWLTQFTSVFPTEAQGISFDAKVTLQLSDFGKAVSVEAPAKADVVEMSDLTGK